MSSDFQSSASFAAFNKDNLSNLQQLGNLRGPDLIRLCNTQAAIRETCNRPDAFGRNIFHRLLKEEFEEDFPPFQDSKTRYIKRHTKTFLILDDDESFIDYESVTLDVDILYQETKRIIYRKFPVLKELRKITISESKQERREMAGIASKSRLFRAILSPANVQIKLDSFPAQSGDILYAYKTEIENVDHLVVLTSSLDIYVYSMEEKTWETFNNPGLILLDLYGDYDNAYLLVRDHTEISIKEIDPYGVDLVEYEHDSNISEFESGFTAIRLLKSSEGRPYFLAEYLDPITKIPYCRFLWILRWFDSRQFPGGLFQFDRSRIKLHYPGHFPILYPPSISSIPIVGVLNDVGELWIGYSRPGITNVYWDKIPSPDKIIDFKFGRGLEDDEFAIHVLERSGKCLFGFVRITDNGINHTSAHDVYYMHVPGLMSIQNHDRELSRAPDYLEVSDIY